MKHALLMTLLVATPVAAEECKPEVVYIDTNRAVRILEAMGFDDIQVTAEQWQSLCPDGGAPVRFHADGTNGERVHGTVCLTAMDGTVRFDP